MSTMEEKIKEVVEDEVENLEETMGEDWRDQITTKEAFGIIFRNAKRRITSPENRKKRRSFLIKLAIVIAAVIGYEAISKMKASDTGSVDGVDDAGLGADIPTDIGSSIDGIDGVDIPDNVEVVNF